MDKSLHALSTATSAPCAHDLGVLFAADGAPADVWTLENSLTGTLERLGPVRLLAGSTRGVVGKEPPADPGNSAAASQQLRREGESSA
jgi:hypothetical protein